MAGNPLKWLHNVIKNVRRAGIVEVHLGSSKFSRRQVFSVKRVEGYPASHHPTLTESPPNVGGNYSPLQSFKKARPGTLAQTVEIGLDAVIAGVHYFMLRGLRPGDQEEQFDASRPRAARSDSRESNFMAETVDQGCRVFFRNSWLGWSLRSEGS